MRPFLRKCVDCGVPLSVSRNHAWMENGTVLSRDSSQRLVVMEREVIDGILHKAEEITGERLAPLFTRAKSIDARVYVSSLMVGWKKAAAAYPIVRRRFYELLCDQARVLGMADARVISYRRGREMVIGCTQCYSIPFFAGDILGAVEAGEGREAKVDYYEENGEKRFVVDIGRGRPAEHFVLEEERPLPGKIKYRCCSRCGVPFPMTFFVWDTERGLIVDTHNGETVAILDIAGMNFAYRQIREKLGGVVDRLLAQEVKDMVDKVLPRLEFKRERPEERVHDLFFLAYRGMGNPIFTKPTDEGMKAWVENPFNYPIVAGITASFLARGKPCEFDWERIAPGRMELRVRFV